MHAGVISLFFPRLYVVYSYSQKLLINEYRTIVSKHLSCRKNSSIIVLALSVPLHVTGSNIFNKLGAGVISCEVTVIHQVKNLNKNEKCN